MKLKKIITLLISILIIISIMPEEKEENLAYYIETNDGYEYRENIPISGYSFEYAKCNGSKVKQSDVEYNEDTKKFKIKDQKEMTGCDLYFNKNGEEIIEEYKINYNLNGGSVSENPESYTPNIEITLKNPTKTGYTFIGWTGSNGLTPQTSVTIPTGSTGNKTYTANYTANTYKVEYDSNEGSGTTESSTHTYDESKTLTKNGFTKEGYTFLGWSTNKEATSATYTDEESVKNLTSTNNETITLYAIWKINTYTVNVTVLNGTVNPSSKETNYNTNVTFEVNKTSGYGSPVVTCTNGQSGSINDSTLTVTNVSNDTTCTVNYTKETYTITYSLDGGSVSGNPESYDVTSSSITLKNPSKTGYTFIGWTGSNGSTPQTTVTIPTGSTGNKNYTANYEINTYDVNVVVNNGTTSPSNKTVNYNTNATFTVNPTTGYHYTSVSCTNNQSASMSGTTLTVSNVSSDTTCTVSNTVNTYKVKYNANGGSGTMSDSTHTYGVNKALSTNTFTRSGYVFAGWSTSTTSSTVTYTNGQSVKNLTTTNNGTVNLYAVWKRQLTVTFNVNGASSVGSTSLSCTVESGTSCSVTAPSITASSGFSVVGWNTSSSATTSSVNVGESIEVSSNITYYAITKSTSAYTVTFEGNGATLSSESASCYRYNGNSTCNVTTPSITRSGYTINGYNTSASSTTASIGANASLSVNGNKTYYAVTSKELTATFYRNGATSITPSGGSASTATSVSQTCTIYNTNTSCNITSPSITKSGWTIIGWGTSASSTTKTNGVNESIDLTSNINRYAVTSKVVSITYNANSGSGAPSASSKTIYNTATSARITLSSTTPTRTGYTFLGWAPSNSESSATYNAGGTYNFSESTTIYAVWKINTYKVNVTVLNGIVEGETSKEVNYQEDTTFTVNASSGYGEPIVSCTNGQSGSISETTLTVSNVTNNTTCTVTYKEIKKGFETIIDKYTENNAEGLIKINQPATSQTPALTEYRYTGKAPKNYVTFNNELWRIIGVFEVDDGTGNYEQRIKIMRDESIGNIGWDYNENGPWSGSSTATLNTYLNGTYYNELSEEVRSMISESKWYTAVINADQTTPNIYIIERGSDKGNIEYGNINWTGKIALAYLSDYGYASSNCYNSSNTLGNYDVCTSSNWLYKNFYWWTIGVAGRSSAMVIDSSGYSHGMRNSADAGVLPTLYLKSNVAITGGEGTSSSPYEISL